MSKCTELRYGIDTISNAPQWPNIIGVQKRIGKITLTRWQTPMSSQRAKLSYIKAIVPKLLKVKIQMFACEQKLVDLCICPEYIFTKSREIDKRVKTAVLVC